MSESREQEALEAYLRLLQVKGASADSLKRREAILTRLSKLIAGKPNDGYIYRDSVESLMDSVDRYDWPFLLSIAREYYPFWTKDIKAIAALNAEAAFDLEPIKWQPLETNLKVVWSMLDKEQFSVSETWPLKAYTLALRQEGAAQNMVDTRVKLVKLLLLRLKDAPDKSHRVYRVAVDNSVPLFTMKDTRRLFLVVVREFFYFWIGDPEAASHILTEATIFNHK